VVRTRLESENDGLQDRCGNIEAFGSEPNGWFLLRCGNRSEHFRCYFAMGRIQGTPCMRSHIYVHRATPKYFSNSFIFKTEIEKEGLPRDSTPDLGAGGPRFESGRPDQNHLACFLCLIESALQSKLPCGIPADRRPPFPSRLGSESSHYCKRSRTRGGRSAIQKLLNGG
jgi:hypothetical protein